MITVIDLKTMKSVPPPSASVLCLGNFDGVHIGHRRLVSVLLEKKQAMEAGCRNIKSGAWFFKIPPTFFLKKEATPQLTSTEQKLSLFASLGLDYAFLADFEELRQISPEDFVKNILIGECHCRFAVCGYNFRFGDKASGDADMLRLLMDGNAEIVDKVTDGNTTVSSSIIRDMIISGNTERAARLLGHPFTICSPVLHGKSIGRKLGMPTANQQLHKRGICPAFGVYATVAEIGGKAYRAISNVGVRPSFNDGDHINCETHIFGYDGDLYGAVLKIAFYKHIRSELCFPSPNALVTQIKKDAEAVMAYFDACEVPI